MAGRAIPETINRGDWSRLVSQGHKDHEGRLAALEAIKPVLQGVGAAWTDATGTASRTALASYAGQTVSNPPTQAEMQTLDNAVKAISQHLVAVINDLKANRSLT